MATRVDVIPGKRQVALAGLVLGPLLLVAALAISMQTDAVARVVPLERAWIQGAIALPMYILSSAALGLAWSDMSVEPAAKWLSRGIAIAILGGVVAWFAGNLSQVGCEPVTSPIQTIRVGLPLGLVAGLGYFGSVAAGRWFASSERPVAGILAAAGAAVLTFAAVLVTNAFLFPGLSCARGPV